MKVLFLLAVLTVFPGVLLFSSNSTNHNFMSSPPEKRLNEFIAVMMKATNSFEQYKSYIATNGLIFDETFETIKMNIMSNSNFNAMINSSMYQSTSNFFVDFKNFSQTYFYLMFSELFKEKSEKEYYQRLDQMEKEYQEKLIDPKINSIEASLADHTIKSIRLMKKKMQEYDVLKKKMNEREVQSVMEKRQDLKKVYKNITE